MTKQHDAKAQQEIEVGHYVVGNAVVIYVNAGGGCIFRQRVALSRELSGMTLRGRLAALRALWSKESTPEPRRRLPCSG